MRKMLKILLWILAISLVLIGIGVFAVFQINPPIIDSRFEHERIDTELLLDTEEINVRAELVKKYHPCSSCSTGMPTIISDSLFPPQKDATELMSEELYEYISLTFSTNDSNTIIAKKKALEDFRLKKTRSGYKFYILRNSSCSKEAFIGKVRFIDGDMNIKETSKSSFTAGPC